MVFLQPEHSAGNEETHHLRPAIVEHQGAPLLVLALPGIGIFIAGGAVEFGKASRVPGEVPGHPVHNHADAHLVAAVYKAHKVMGCAIPGGGGKISHHLVAPGAVIRVFRQGHELNMGEAHIPHIGNQLIPQLFIGEHAAICVFPPGTGMHLIDIHRLVIVGVPGLLVIPGLVVPLIPLQVIPPGGRAGPRFAVAGIGVCLVGILSPCCFDIKFIQLIGSKLEVRVALPHPVVQALQGVFGSIPIAEISH